MMIKVASGFKNVYPISYMGTWGGRDVAIECGVVDVRDTYLSQ